MVFYLRGERKPIITRRLCALRHNKKIQKNNNNNGIHAYWWWAVIIIIYFFLNKIICDLIGGPK